MKILLIYPQWTGGYGVFGHFARRQSCFPPINLALLAATAEQQGHEVKIIDAEVNNICEEIVVQMTLAANPEVVGLSCYSPFFHLNTSLAQKLKDAGCKAKILVGGPHITIMKEKALVPQFDYLFVGDAEESFIKFLAVYQKGGDLSEVGGIIFRRSDGHIYAGQAKWIEASVKITGATRSQLPEHPLDKLPFPARHLLPMNKYRMGTMHGRMHFTTIQTLRGCPWHCIFCASEALNTTRMLTRSAKSVVEEIKKVVADFPFLTHFYFVDEVLTLWEEHILEVSDRIIAEGLKITFEGATRANLVNSKQIEKMAKAGLVRLAFGLETVDAEMRQTMRKQVKLEDYTKANQICESWGVEALNSVMIGLPGETRETIKKTLDFLRQAREVKQANFAIAVPYPGTEFSDMAIAGAHGMELVSKDFSEYLRYGSAVTKVGDLTPQDLIDLQNEGFVSIYSAPWRWKSMLRKHGIMGFILLMLRVARLWKNKIFKRKQEPLSAHPKDN